MYYYYYCYELENGVRRTSVAIVNDHSSLDVDCLSIIIMITTPAPPEVSRGYPNSASVLFG